MSDSAAVLHCYQLDAAEKPRPVQAETVAPSDQRLIWLHLNGRSHDTKKILKDQLHIDAIVVKALLAEETRPRLEEAEGKSLLILRSVNFNPGPEPEDLVSIRLWVSDRLIVSVGRRKSRAVADITDKIKSGMGPRTTGEFISQLCVALGDAFEPALQELENTTDGLEYMPIEHTTPALRDDLSNLRKQATLFRRHIAPQRDVISRLCRSQQAWMKTSDLWSLQESHDRATRFIEDLDALRERTQILQDEIYSALSARLNRNIYMLSIISAVFMPLTFISGLLGMNLSGIPFAESPKAFAVVCLGLFSLSFFILYALKRLRSF
jgi:zinc transporter